MKLKDILFVGGDVSRLASVKIRCKDVAERLGVKSCFLTRENSQIPNGYKVYICVKPGVINTELETLSERGLVVWDILDDKPPSHHISCYIASTETAARHFSYLGNIHTIPHYHCNIERRLSVGDPLKVGYIGSAHWYPQTIGFEHMRFLTDSWERLRVSDAYRSIGVAINLRNTIQEYAKFARSSSHTLPDLKLHVAINSGMKLINCLGFGLPSISADEPAYYEIAPECTLFCDLESSGELVRELQSDSLLYTSLRKNCLLRAEEFHLDNIIKKYRKFIASL